MNRFYFLLCLLLCPYPLLAQTNYKPGLVVTLEGDTLRGFINYREWSNTPNSISFRETAAGGTEQQFTPGTARYVEITGMEAYQRFQGAITMNEVALDRIPYESKPLSAPVEIFLKVNYTGELISLLSYTDNIKTRFFYQEKDGSPPQELYFNRYYASSNTIQMVEQKGYVGQLQFLLNKLDVYSNTLNREIESAKYTAYDMENLFNKINRVRVASPKTKDQQSSAYRYFAGLGLNGSNVRFNGITGLHVPASNPISYMPRLTFGADVFLNKHIQKLFFRVEGALTAANYHAENEVISKQKETYNFSYKISQQSLSLSPQLIYNFYNKDNFKFYGGIIAQLSLSNYSQNTYREAYRKTFEDENKPEVYRLSEVPDFMRLETFWFTYAFRAGTVINKRYELYAVYAPYAMIAKFGNNEIAVRSLYLGVNYLFNKN